MWFGFLNLLLLFSFNILSVINPVSCNATTTTNTTANATQRATLDDIKRLPMDYYCKFQANAHLCTQRTQRRYYFDLHLHACARFEYANCDHSYNMFVGRHECLTSCQDVAYTRVPENTTANVYCRFQPQFGDCNSYHPMWYFDIKEMRCRGFSYSGCGGNHNRFHTNTDCLSTCGAVILKH